MAVSVKKQANALLAGVSLAAAASYPWAQSSVLLDFVHHTALAATIGEDAGTIEDVYEPYLLKKGFLIRTPRGRMATEKSYHHLGLQFQ